MPPARRPLARRLSVATNPIPATLVAGPPCAGKTTWVRAHGHPGDLVVDLDALHAALTVHPAGVTHSRAATMPYVFDARDAILARLAHTTAPVRHAWIIATAPTRQERHAAVVAYHARPLLVLAAPATCHARATAPRPPAWHEYIDRWFDVYEPDTADEIVSTDAP